MFLVNGNAQIRQDSSILSHTDSLIIAQRDSILNLNLDLQNIDSIILDTIIAEVIDIDSIIIDSIYVDSSSQNEIKIYNIAPDPIDGDIDWGAKDLEFFDKESNKMKLYVNYGTIKLTAGYIEFDLSKNEIIGKSILDSLGRETQIPKFIDKESEFIASELRYNIKTQKGYVKYAVKKEGDLTIHGKIGKFLSGEADTINQVDNMYIKGGLITNCSNPKHPHWGINASKVKLIPNKLAVFGPSVFEIAGIPLYPAVLPFGFYPMFQGQKSGLILPQRLDYNNDFGVGVKDIGVYFAINDYIDLRVTGDIYSRGTHGLYIKTNYSKRYKYSGNFSFKYFNAIRESATDTTIYKSPTFSFALTHNQAAKAHPYQKFGGNINLSLNGYQRAANTDYDNRSNNIIRSNFSYTNSLPSTPFSMSLGLSHSQNNQTHVLDLTLPHFSLNMNTIYPFKSKKAIGKPKWYEDISLKYRGEAKNIINAKVINPIIR